MLTVSNTQLGNLQESLNEGFLPVLSEFLTEYFPNHVRTMGRNQLDAFGKISIERANRHGLHTEREQQIFATYGILFGLFFDVDPQYPWAGDRLSRPGLDAHQRIELFRLRAEQAVADLEESARRNNQLKTIAELDPATLSVGSVDASSPLANWYATLFPCTTSWMRPRDMVALTAKAEELSREAGLLSDKGPKLVIAATGMLGSSFIDDPQFAKLVSTLKSDLSSDEKTQSFSEAGRSFASHWVKLRGEQS